MWVGVGDVRRILTDLTKLVKALDHTTDLISFIHKLFNTVRVQILTYTVVIMKHFWGKDKSSPNTKHTININPSPHRRNFFVIVGFNGLRTLIKGSAEVILVSTLDPFLQPRETTLSIYKKGYVHCVMTKSSNYGSRILSDRPLTVLKRHRTGPSVLKSGVSFRGHFSFPL